jgi:hypothetical protein
MAKLTGQEQTAPDEGAAVEPEIEADESSEAEPEKAPDESAAVEGDEVEVGCPISMYYHGFGPRCGRKLHVAPEGVDEKHVCLMHSNDPVKQSGPLFEEFRLEFERVPGFMMVEREPSLQSATNVRISSLPTAPFGERSDGRQIIPGRQFLKKQVCKRRR